MKNELPRDFVLAREYVLGNVEALRSKYGHNHMAILADIGVIDSDSNKYKLAKRIQLDNHFNPQEMS